MRGQSVEVARPRDVRPSADGHFLLDRHTGRIVGALTREGEVELVAMRTRWTRNHRSDGGEDYAVKKSPQPSGNGREPERPQPRRLRRLAEAVR
jgi:hypothetical protein